MFFTVYIYDALASIISDAAKSFVIPAISLSNYFDLTKLFSDLHLAKFLDILTKPFFPCFDKNFILKIQFYVSCSV